MHEKQKQEQEAKVSDEKSGLRTKTMRVLVRPGANAVNMECKVDRLADQLVEPSSPIIEQ